MLPDLEDFTVEDLRELLATDCISELTVGKNGIGNLSDILNVIDGASVTRLVTPEMFSRRFIQIGDPHDIQSIRGAGIRCKPWSSPLSRLPRPKKFPIIQLLHVLSPGTISAAGAISSPWSRMMSKQGLTGREVDISLLSLPMSEYLVSATNAMRFLSRFLNAFAPEIPSSMSLEIGRTLSNLMERFSLQVSIMKPLTAGEVQG